MSKKAIDKAELMNHVLSIHKIECEKCHVTDEVGYCDEFDALDSFYEIGWRIVKEKCLCKKCQKL